MYKNSFGYFYDFGYKYRKFSLKFILHGSEATLYLALQIRANVMPSIGDNSHCAWNISLRNKSLRFAIM